ncbi:hypothetical protein NSQ82_05195 [Caldifermentibacillus hisashii]|uniref:hypothetical protein n=1 Tax=Caldifermentibacillus hisashii TaxID=996558 RepID=UPI0031017F89
MEKIDKMANRLAESYSMGQNRQTLKPKCLIEQLYGTNQVEKEDKMSHRSTQTAFYGTKPPDFETQMSHRTALWDKSSGKRR